MSRSARTPLRTAKAHSLPRGARNSNSIQAAAPNRSVNHRLVWLCGIVLLVVGCEKPDAPHHFATLLDTHTQLCPEWAELLPVDSLRADRDNNCLVITLSDGYR